MSEPLPDWPEWTDLPSQVTPITSATLMREREATLARVGLKLDARGTPAGGPLRKWFASLSGQTVAPAQIVVIGDSISEGSGASDILHRWVTQLQAALRSATASSGAEFPFIPAFPASGTNWPIARAGSVLANASWGLGWRTAVLQDATASLTVTFTGTRCKVMYVKTGSTGAMSLVIDSGTPVVVNTNSSAGGGSNAAVWDSGALSPGSHTLTITRDASSSAGQHPYIQGVLTYNGDEAAGVRVLDASHSGYSSVSATASTRAQMAATALAAAGGASLAVIAYGTNDVPGPTLPATFRANIEALIASLRTTAGFTGSIILLGMYKGSVLDDTVFAGFGAQMAAIAATDPDVTYLDLRTLMPDVPTPYSDPAGLGLFADDFHPGSPGHGWIASVVQAQVALSSAAAIA